MSDAKNEIRNRLNDPATVLEKLNLLDGAKHSVGKYTVCCPWHGENTPSCQVRQHPNDGTLAVKCFGCGHTSDVFGLIARAYDLSDNQFPEIIAIAADMAGVQLDDSKPINRERPVFKPPPPPEYPPVDELREMWGSAIKPVDDPQVAAWFESRGLSTDVSTEICRVIPLDYELPEWAIYRDESHEKGRYDWLMSGHRLIFPLYNAEGRIRSFKIRCVTDGKLKNVNPRGYSTAGLCFACETGQDALNKATPVETAVIVEGEVDFLSSVQNRQDDKTAVYGVYSGAWSDDHAARVSADNWYFLTDDDDPGDGYIDAVLGKGE